MSENECNNECKIAKINKILKLLNNNSFFHLYGTQFFICIFLIIFQCIVVIKWSFKKNIQYYKENWPNVRCLPHIMPFAGIINKPKDMTVIAYTQENYDYCNKLTIDKEMTTQFQPLFEQQESFNKNQSNSIKINAMTANAGSKSAISTQSSVNSGVNIAMVVFGLLKYGFNLFTDIFTKILDVITGFFNFSLSGVTWSTMFLKILNRSVMIIIAIFFVISVVPTIPFWFLIIPLIYFILYVVVLVLGNNLSNYVSIVPNAMAQFEPFTTMKSRPKISLCFDENTQILTSSGIKKIKKIKVGDILEDGSMITATFKTMAYPVMFNLNGIIVSGDHYVHYKKWIKVKNHPDSFPIYYDKNFLFCLNTTSKKIKIKNHIFLDWDELEGKKMKLVESYLKKQNKCLEELHSVMDRGYNRQFLVKMKKGFKKICNIQPGEILRDGSKILALVTIKGDDIYGKSKQLKKYNVVTDNGYFRKKPDYNFIIDNLFYMYLI